MNQPAPPRKPEVALEAGVQARLLEQMREEQAASQRIRQLRMFGLFPATVAASLASILMMFSPDSSTSIIGSFLAQGIGLFLWIVRKRIGSVFGFR